MGKNALGDTHGTVSNLCVNIGYGTQWYCVSKLPNCSKEFCSINVTTELKFSSYYFTLRLGDQWEALMQSPWEIKTAPMMCSAIRYP